jgi:hypothetical protein
LSVHSPKTRRTGQDTEAFDPPTHQTIWSDEPVAITIEEAGIGDLAPTQSLVDRIQRLQRYQRLQGRSVFNLCELSAIYVRGPGISRKLGKTALAARTASFPPGWRRACDGQNDMTCIADTHSAIIRVMTVARASAISWHTGRSKGVPFEPFRC